MKLHARARLLATSPRKEVSGPVTLVLSDGTKEKFGSAHEFTTWLRSPKNQLHMQFIAPVGRYAVLTLPSKSGVVKLYTNVWETTRIGKDDEGSPFAERFIQETRASIKRSLDLLKRTHHPMLREVEKDADEIEAYFEELLPALKLPHDLHDQITQRLRELKKLGARRTQKWFHSLTAEEQDAYCSKFPGTRFRNRITLTSN